MFQSSLLFILSALLGVAPAHAWDHHQGLMMQMMSTNAASQRAFLKKTLIIPSEAEQKKTILSLAQGLEVNAEKIPIQKPGKVTVKEFLQGESIDEPDFGMDQDLPDSADPKNDRAWMGGKTGPTSQGFRHMFFPGMEWTSPIRTLQIPPRAIGQAPERILKMHEISKKFFQDKDLFWGLRTLLWELHLVQDLHQPFHVTQVPYIRMIPWKELFHGFVARSTQVIANYHYAYEGLVRESIQEEELSTLAPCFELSQTPSFPEINRAMIQEIIKFSHEKAHEIGIPLYQLWDSEMKDPAVNLPEEIGSIDYYSYLHASSEEEGQKEKVEAVSRLLKTSCDLMKHLTEITFSEIDRALK